MRGPVTLRSPMPRPTKRSVLAALTRERLFGLADKFELEAPRSVLKPDLLDLLVRATRAPLERVLAELSPDELKEICRAHGLDDAGKVKQAIVERILAQGGSHDGETAEASYASATVGDPRAQDAGWTAPSVELPKRVSRSTSTDQRITVDLERLLKLRVVVARFGEMDGARWWNTKGQLGRLGAAALRRGFPRTHRFAQARSVFAVAAHRCTEVFEPPGCVTLWHLPEAVEEAFDARWEHWLDNAGEWTEFFEKLESLPGTELTELLRSFELVEERDLEAYGRLRRSAEGRAVPLPGVFAGTDADVALLALGFARGEAGALAVPYARRGA